LIVWYIHGAGASDKSFAWLHAQLNVPAQFFSYSLSEPAASAIQRLAAALVTDGRPAMLVGHSLGGIMASACAATSNVERLVTICAPFGGMSYAELLSLFLRHHC
jgi:pimeloyl-ACP methyl ester carboxylesterase